MNDGAAYGVAFGMAGIAFSFENKVFLFYFKPIDAGGQRVHNGG